MTTLAHSLSQLLPKPLARWLQPKWHSFKVHKALGRLANGSVRRHDLLDCQIAERDIDNVRFRMPVRNQRELRRFTEFGHRADDIVFHWLRMIDDCEVLYDFGAANGQEGFFAYDKHECHVIFVEIYPPSIEDLLKGVALRIESGADIEKLDIIAGGGGKMVGFDRMYLHNPPLPGGTANSFSDLSAYCRGGREAEPIFGSVFMPSVGIDWMQETLKLPAPTHIKIDVDGPEDKIVASALETLKARSIRSWMIEVSPGRERPIEQLLTAHGYVEIASFEHYPDIDDCWDRLYVRDDLIDEYKKRMDIA